MAHKNQITFIKQNRDLIKEPILLVGAKVYDYDQFDLKAELIEMGYVDITGTDIESGTGVDHVLDITDADSEFIQHHKKHFSTVFCMEVLTNVKNPFAASLNVEALLKTNGIVFLSECFIRKISKMPVDYWRFTIDGLKTVFDQFTFFDDRCRFSITRQRDGILLNFKGKFIEIMKDSRHPDESRLGFLLRRIHRKWFSKGIFNVSRLMPEQTIYAVGKLK